MRRLGIIVIGVVGLLLLGRILSAAIAPRLSVDTEGLVFGENYIVPDQVTGDLIVVAESVTFPTMSRIMGDAVLIGENVTISGEVEGDLAAIGEMVTIESGSEVGGDLALMGEQVTLAGGVGGNLLILGDRLVIQDAARISGEFTACASAIDDQRAADDEAFKAFTACENAEPTTMALEFLPFYADGFHLPDLNIRISGLGTFVLLFSVLASLALSAIAVLVVTIFPRHISYIEEAMRATPRNLGSFGFVSFVLALGLVVGFVVVLALAPVVGLILLPVLLLGGLIFFGMLLIGWVTVALLVGDWLLQRATHDALPPLVGAAVGSVALFVLWHVLMLIPFGIVVNLLGTVVLGSLGLGATLTTRIGTNPLRQRYFIEG